ncbi:TetR/AcrR family transcriptional regulator C-terminal domain-containing protein [Tomitella biformata]|uniref:TetR/AcrR family transcriptional regulator C-terminal domain-containing protein n=1 Tax=Tomitella biformata TaxID=630403 RepID=UPI0004642EBA|nr:TetR/AcrR family transcriptional regulator C-terminal domain-containing protein [Tomitella biformata]
MTDHEVAALPPGLDLLWGRRERGRQGRKADLSLDAIIAAAIAVADAEGLAAVSMARVAKDLGFSTMSLYRHVQNKDELLQLMWNASAIDAPVITGDDWRARLRSWAVGQWNMLKVRRWVLEMPMIAPPAGPNSLAWVEQAMQALADTPLSEAEKLGCVGLLSSFTLGEARMSHEETKAAGTAKPMDYGAVLRAVADERGYPALHHAAWSGELEGAGDTDPDAGFQFGLERILDGVEALVRRAG